MKNRSFVFSLILLIVSPILSLVQVFFAKNLIYFRWVLIAFITVYGSVLVLDPSVDGYRHQSNVIEYYGALSFADFLKDTYNILSFKTADGLKGDLYIHVLSYIVGGVMGLPKLFFPIVSFIYAYFFSGSLFLLIKKWKVEHFNIFLQYFIVVFIFIKGLEGINTVRTWSGMWVLIYAVLMYLNTKKERFLILSFIPPLIHIGYFIMGLPVWIVLLFGNFKKIFVFIFCISFLSTIFNPVSLTSQFESYEIGESKVRGYQTVDEDGVVLREGKDFSQTNWYVRMIGGGSINVGLQIIVFAFIIFGIYFFKMNEMESTLFSIGILFFALSNFTYFIYALQNRTGFIADLFIIASIVSILQRGGLNYLKFWQKTLIGITFLIFSFLSFPLLVLRISELLDFMSFFLLFFPPIIWALGPEVNFSIKEAIKSVFALF